jgi:zinc transporter 2
VINPREVDGLIMLITAVIGLIFNLVMAKMLHSSGYHHHHGHSHGHSVSEYTSHAHHTHGHSHAHAHG